MRRMNHWWVCLQGAVLAAALWLGAASAWSQPPREVPLLRQPHETSPPPGAPLQLPVPGEAILGDAPPQPVTTAVTLEQLEGMALQSNPSLAEAGQRVRAAQGAWIQAGLYPNPSIGYSGEEIGGGGSAGMHGMMISQQIVRGGKLALARSTAAAAVARAQEEFAAQRLRVLTDVRVAFYEAMVAQMVVEEATKLLRVAEEGVRAAQQLFDAREVSRVDVLQAQLEAGQARITLQNARNDHTGAWRRLAAVVGRPELPPTRLLGEPRQQLPDLNWHETLSRLLAEAPQMAIAQAELERTRRAVRQAVAQPIPNLQLQGSAMYDDGPHTAMGEFQVTLPVPLFDRNQGGIRQARAQQAAAEAAIERTALNLQQQLAAAFAQYANAKQQVDRYVNELLPQAQQTIDLVLAGYREGELGYITLLQAQHTYFRVNLAYLDSLRNARTAAARIEGMLLQGSLQPVP